jgi:putative PIN family toxin of toxin-antitoxin system
VLAVIDTNVFVSALLQGRGTPRRLYEAFLQGKFTPLFSHETLGELLDVLTRPSLRSLTSQEEVAALLDVIQHDALLIHPRHHVTVCRDPKDNMFLDCLLAGADYLVTGDNDLLVLNPFHGTRILRPTEFLRVLR